jgi:hypothetical protein
MPVDRSTDDLAIRLLAPGTWRAFADVVERRVRRVLVHLFPLAVTDKDPTYESNRDLECQLVEHERAHARAGLDGDEAVAWAEFGPPGNCPNIHHRQEYEAGLVTAPDFRITCIFVDRRYRRRGSSGRSGVSRSHPG